MSSSTAATKVPVAYLMGAGRSGTTVLAALLGMHEGVVAVGELNQLPAHLRGERDCACGQSLRECPIWSPLIDQLRRSADPDYEWVARRLERHGQVWRHFLSRRHLPPAYSDGTVDVYRTLSGSRQRLVVDSSKYVGRAISLARVPGLDVRIVYVVRDPRGVAFSFGKRVQTRRGFMSALYYYTVVNSAAEIAARTLLKGRVLKVRYEDLTSNPAEILDQLGSFLGLDVKDLYKASLGNGSIVPGHLVGGNRLRSRGAVTLRSDMEWAAKLPRSLQVLGWVATSPLSALNGYPLLR